MSLFNLSHRKYHLDLINLSSYEADLKLQRERKIVLRPPWPIPAKCEGDWTEDEMAAMRENRALAKEIYHRIKGER